LTGKRKNLIGKEGNVERLRDRREALEKVEDGLMTRFDGHDGSGCGEDAGLLDEVRGTEVRADADVLDELGEGHHGRDVGEHARKVVLALHGRHAEIDDDVLDRGHMHELVLLYDRDLLDDDVRRLEAGIGVVGRLELFQSLLVELRLEILEHKGELEDLDGARVDGTSERRSPRGEWDKEGSNREKCGNTHFQYLLVLFGVSSWISPAVCVPEVVEGKAKEWTRGATGLPREIYLQDDHQRL